MKPRILVTRAVFPEHLERLAEHFEIDANQGDEPIASADLVLRLADKQAALITGGDRIDAATLAGAPLLRAVSTISVGTNHIDIAACTARGVRVTNTPDVLTETTADFGWALLMATARRVTEAEHWLRAGRWQRWSLSQFLGADLHHTTLAILGMGRIGQAMARRAAGFAMPVIYHNRSRLPRDVEEACRARYVARPALFEEADHVMLVLPYAPEHHHSIGAAELAMMKPTATLINIARGGLIDEGALANALATGKLAGAGLDVFEGEPQVDARLLALTNVVLTPHIASASRPTRDAMARLAIDNLVAALADRLPPNLVNPVTIGSR